MSAHLENRGVVKLGIGFPYVKDYADDGSADFSVNRSVRTKNRTIVVIGIVDPVPVSECSLAASEVVDIQLR